MKTNNSNIIEVTDIENLYKSLSLLLQAVIEKTSLPSRDVAKLIRYMQRCKNDGELLMPTAPNIANVLGLIREKGSDLFDVSSAQIVKIENKLTGDETTYIIKNKLSYGRKYSRENRRIGGIPIQNDDQPIDMAVKAQDESTE